MLATYRTGPETDTPLLIAHGLYGSGRNFGAIARRLADERPVLTVDMRNHGDSPWTERHGYEEMAADLAEVIEAHGGTAHVLGHSMGGKAAMMLALTRPDLVESLLVADISPVPYDHGQLELVHAMQGVDPAAVASRGAADARLAETVTDPGVRAFLLHSLDLKAQPPRWRLNLDVLAAEMDRILGWPEIDASYDEPALFLAGSESDYVLPKYRAATKALFPNAGFAKIPGTGHWLHAEKPLEFTAAVRQWLSK